VSLAPGNGSGNAHWTGVSCGNQPNVWVSCFLVPWLMDILSYVWSLMRSLCTCSCLWLHPFDSLYLSSAWGSFQVPKSNLLSVWDVDPLSQFGFSTEYPDWLVCLPRKRVSITTRRLNLSLSGDTPRLEVLGALSSLCLQELSSAGLVLPFYALQSHVLHRASSCGLP